eukprot:2833060-Prymnesium_polylepis.2
MTGTRSSTDPLVQSEIARAALQTELVASQAQVHANRGRGRAAASSTGAAQRRRLVHGRRLWNVVQGDGRADADDGALARRQPTRARVPRALPRAGRRRQPARAGVVHRAVGRDVREVQGGAPRADPARER